MYGQTLYSMHSLLFLIITLVLLVALIGVIVLTIQKPKGTYSSLGELKD